MESYLSFLLCVEGATDIDVLHQLPASKQEVRKYKVFSSFVICFIYITKEHPFFLYVF